MYTGLRALPQYPTCCPHPIALPQPSTCRLPTASYQAPAARPQPPIPSLQSPGRPLPSRIGSKRKRPHPCHCCCEIPLHFRGPAHHRFAAQLGSIGVDLRLQIEEPHGSQNDIARRQSGGDRVAGQRVAPRSSGGSHPDAVHVGLHTWFCDAVLQSYQTSCRTVVQHCFRHTAQFGIDTGVKNEADQGNRWSYAVHFAVPAVQAPRHHVAGRCEEDRVAPVPGTGSTVPVSAAFSVPTVSIGSGERDVAHEPEHVLFLFAHVFLQPFTVNGTVVPFSFPPDVSDDSCSGVSVTGRVLFGFDLSGPCHGLVPVSFRL